MPGDEFPEAQAFVQLPHQHQATIRSHPRPLEVDLQRAIERELKVLFLRLTHRRSTSAPPGPRQTPRLSRALQDSIKLVVDWDIGNAGLDMGPSPSPVEP